jgi:hypothetical protein
MVAVKSAEKDPFFSKNRGKHQKSGRKFTDKRKKGGATIYNQSCCVSVNVRRKFICTEKNHPLCISVCPLFIHILPYE